MRLHFRPVSALALLAAAVFYGGAAHATTLDPRHPLWSGPMEIREGFREALVELKAERTALAIQQKHGSGKGLGPGGGRLLVIPVYYAGQQPPAGISQQNLEAAFFGADESSVRGCFEQMSGGRFVLEGRVAPWTQLPEDLSLYRNVLDGRATSPFLAGPRLLVRDALRAASETFDLTRFDDDGPDGLPGSGDDDGFVDLLVLLHPDPGFESGLQPVGPAMLAHQSHLSTRDDFFAATGAMGRDYMIASAHGSLGVWLHEFGHLLGLEDLYDLASLGEPGISPGGLGLWSLMAGGSWGGGGAQPSALDAWSRRQLDWDERLEETTPGAASFGTPAALHPASAAVEGLGDWQGEHFLLELREPDPQGVLDGALPGGGALLYRIDPLVPITSSAPHPAVTLLQADGRDDLGDGSNQGDAGDAFSALIAQRIVNGGTLPSTESIRPAPGRLAPEIEFNGAQSDGGMLVAWRASELPGLELEEAYFEDGTARRSHLFPLENSEWHLRFRPVGSPGSAQLELLSLPDSLLLHGPNPVALVPVGGIWQPATSWSLETRWAGAQFDAGEVELSLTVDGGASRGIQIGVPVSVLGGLDTAGFYRWESVVTAASFDTTQFAPIPVEEIPFAVVSAFELVTGGTAGYDDGVECELLSPWFAPDEAGMLRLWSHHASEMARGIQAWDGGVLEVQLPDRPWRALRPEGDGVSWIRSASEATTRGRWGFGGRASLWSAYTAELPAVDLPMRVRLRFGSDGIFSNGYWAVGDVGSRTAGPRAEIRFEDLSGRRVRADVQLRGDVSRLFNGVARFHWRRPHEDVWNPLPETRILSGFEQAFQMELDLPLDTDLFQFALFFESFGSQPVLLGRAGHRMGQLASSLLLLGNPAMGEARFSLGSELERAHLDLFDLRGRLLRTLRRDPDQIAIVWDGRDAAGRRVSSGSYFAVVRERPELKTKFLWIPR